MSKYQFALLAGAAALTAAVLATPAVTQQPQQPPFATTKVEGTDGVYIFRNGGAQSMFVVTRDGVIAVDPIGYARPEGVQDYVNEIKKITSQPIRYLVYSRRQALQGRRRPRNRAQTRQGAARPVAEPAGGAGRRDLRHD